jgi:Flp pilus assembly protein TadD
LKAGKIPGSVSLGAYVFISIFILRLIVLARLTASSFLMPTQGDMHFYDAWARRILQGQLTDHQAFYGLPGYPYLLALLYKIFGYSPFAPGFLQAMLDAGTALILYKLGASLFSAESEGISPPSPHPEWNFFQHNRGKLIGAIAALGWGFFVPAQAYSVILMPTSWLIFIFWFVIWRLVKNDRTPAFIECLLLGLLIGITATGIATILFLIPLVLVALVIKAALGKEFRSVLVASLLLLAGVAFGTSPAWLHNYFVARDPVFLSAHSGINFWIGNNPVANGYPRFPPGLRAGQAAMLQDSITGAETALGRPLKRSEVSAYWSAQAKNYIARNFRDWLRLLGRKAHNFWSAFQYDDLSIISNLREQGIIFPGLYFGIVAAFGIPGMFLAWRAAPASRWLTAAILLQMISLLPVFVTERYRMAAVPGLMLFAAFGLGVFWQSCATSALRPIVIYFALLLCSTIVVALPQRDPSLWALDAYNSGWQALESGNLPLAQKKLQLAFAYVPNNPETNFALGNLRLAQGDPAAATLFYRATLTYDPRHKGALNNLGVTALEDHRNTEAETWFRQALAQDPRDAKTHYLLATTLSAEGNAAAAKSEIDRAVELAPTQPEFTSLKAKIDKSLAP